MNNSMKKKRLSVLITASLVVSSLQGCATVNEVKTIKASTEKSIQEQRAPTPEASVQSINAPYVYGQMLRPMPKLPAVLNQQVTLKSHDPMTVFEIARWVMDKAGVPVSTDNLLTPASASSSSATTSQNTTSGDSTGNGAVTLPALPGAAAPVAQDTTPRINITYHGKLSGLLDEVASKAGVWWKYDEGRVIFYSTETKTFQLPALAWSTKSSGSIATVSGASTASDSGSGGGSGGSNNTSNGATSVAMASDVDFWKGIDSTAKAMSNGGLVVTDPSTGTITVTGAPPQVRQVESWVKTLSKQLSQQVAITVHVYNVKVNKEDNYGLNLTGAFQNVAKQYGFALTGAPSPTPLAGAAMNFGANILSAAGVSSKSNEWSGSGAAVQALSSLGNVSQVFSQSIVTLNGQPAPIQVAQQTVYLASSSSTSTTASTTDQLSPGSLTTGFTAMFLPHISDGKIYLGMNMTISNLDQMKTVTSGSMSIEAPQTSNSTFQQSVRLQPGQSLMLTGFTQKSGSSTNNGVGSPFMPALGGGVDASTKDNMIAIVITARII